MKKKLLRVCSMFLAIVMLCTILPYSAFAEAAQNAAAGQKAGLGSEKNAPTPDEATLEYQLGGGSFAQGYTAPAAYPAEALPDATQLAKPGFSFVGWYDNADFSGAVLTAVAEDAYTGNVVLYARWAARDYYVDIPATANADGGSLNVNIRGGGFYPDDKVSVTVNSTNEWQLKNGDTGVGYTLSSGETALENGGTVAELTAEAREENQELTLALENQPSYAGDYSDTLNFNVSFAETKYTITYQANGGELSAAQRDAEGNVQKDDNGNNILVPITAETLLAGTAMDTLPIPGKAGAMFIGWCYDPELTRYVDSSDRLLGDLTLYAAYTETQPIEETRISTYARAADADPETFVISITDTSSELTAEAVRVACTLVNLSDYNTVTALTVTPGEGNTYTVKARDGWTPGANYTLTLSGDALFFTGFDTTIREYDFNIYKEDVLNVGLNADIRYINENELLELTSNGKAISHPTVALMTVSPGRSAAQNNTDNTGTFRYLGEALQVGQQIAVYAGDAIPVMSAMNEDAEVSFFEITAVNGDTYSYKGSDSEDILFVPDVLPISTSDDTDGDADNHSLTVPFSKLAYTGESDMEKVLGLSADTTIDAGDFISFYSGTLQQDGDGEQGMVSQGYAVIDTVTCENNEYILTYTPIEYETMQAAMDAYRSTPVSGDKLLEGEDPEAVEHSVEQQAIESGFAQEVANQISQVAMRTESYEELQKNLADTLGADSVTVTKTKAKASALGARADAKVECELDHVTARLGTELKNFDDAVSGLRLTLDIGAKITFHASEDVDFELVISAKFEQEVRIDIDVDGSAEWRWWGIFPYIAEYRVTASLELYEYTGIELDVTFKSAEGEGGDEKDEDKERAELNKQVDAIAKEMKKLMDAGAKYITSDSDITTRLEDIESEDDLDELGKDELSIAKSLGERYADMLDDDADWVELYKHALMEHHVRVLLIIDFEFKIEFVISLNVNISLGMSYWYKNAKRYVYCLAVFARTVTNNTVDLCEEQYEFSVYAMGTIGLRAGIRITLAVGLLSTKLDCIGITAEVGGYAQVWGYLYYYLKYSASAGKSSNGMGAVYFEVGLYGEVKFLAQVLGGTIQFNPTLIDARWPLYWAGSLKSVVDFNYEQKDVEDVQLKRLATTAELPEDLFTMQYLDMKEGMDEDDEGEKVYFTSSFDHKERYDCTVTNPAFTFDPDTNIITVNPGGEPQQDGELIITWKPTEGTFFAKPLQRRVKLHWDNLRDGYYISFSSNGGSTVPMLTARYGAELTAPEPPTKQGYTFAGWYTDAECTKAFTVPATMPDEDTIVYAKWTPAKVEYTVEHYTEQTNGTYALWMSDIQNALTDETVSPKPYQMDGFITPETQSAVVRADGNTVLQYYYPRASFTIQFESDDAVVSTGSYRYDTTLAKPSVAKPGFDFGGWAAEIGGEAVEVPLTVPAQDSSYYAIWTPSENTAYAVRYYLQNADDDGYTLMLIDSKTAKTGTAVAAKALADDAVQGYHLRNEALPEGTVSASGDLVLRVYYDRDTYSLQYDPNGGSFANAADAEAAVIRWGAKAAQRVPTRTGYAFLGWFAEGSETAFDGTMPKNDLTLTARWQAQAVNYTVQHWLQNVEGTGYDMAESEPLSATANSTVTPATKSYAGFTAPVPAEQTVAADGSTVVRYEYARNSHTLTYVYGDGRADLVQENTRFEAAVNTPAIRTGYQFDGWFADAEHTERFSGTMPDHDLTLYAAWTPKQVDYRVEHRLQALDGSYGTAQTIENLTAAADSEIQPERKAYEGFTVPDAKTVTVKADGTTLVTYDYPRNSYALTLVLYEGTDDIVRQTLFGMAISESPQREGFAFAGWYTDAACTTLFGGTMPAGALTLYAKWEESKATYMVNHLWQSLTNPEQYELHEPENLTADIDAEVTPAVRSYEGFTAPATQTVTVKADGSTVVNYRYTRNSYAVTYELNGGSGVADGTLPYGSTITARPTRTGYTFNGWYTDTGLTVQAPATVPAEALALHAGWTAATVPYTVEHYWQNANDDGKTLHEQQPLEAKTDASVTPEVKTYAGFVSPKAQTVTVAGNGSTVVQYTYTRSTNTLTLNSGFGDEDETLMRYGAAIPSPAPRPGYLFKGWFNSAQGGVQYSGTMPNAALTLYARWTAQTVNYKVEHWLQTADGESYVERTADAATLSALAGASVTPEVNSYPGFTAPDSRTVSVAGDGSTVVRYEYTRSSFTLNVTLNNGAADVNSTLKFGEALNLPTPEKTGYTFGGWYTDSGCTAELAGDTMPAQSLTVYAKWTPSLVGYTVRHYLEELNGSYKLAAAEPKQGYSDSQVTPSVNSYTGFTAPGTSTVAVKPDGTTAVEYRYTRNSYTLTFDAAGGTGGTSSSVKYGAAIAAPAVSRTGYRLDSWSPAVAATMPAHNVTCTASWSLISYAIGYNLNGGTAQNPNTYNAASCTITLNNPTLTGYNFAGWSGTGLQGYRNTAVTIPMGSTGDRSYTANWTPITYTINYDANSVTPYSGLDAITATYGVMETAPTWSASGYSFLGWAKTPGGAVEYDVGDDLLDLRDSQDDSITLYAKWKANDFYTFRAAGPFRVKDDDKTGHAKFHFFINEDEAGITDYMPQEMPEEQDDKRPYNFCRKMPGFNYEVAKANFTKAEITVSYRATEINDGWQTILVTKRDAANSESWTDLRKKDETSVDNGNACDDKGHHYDDYTRSYTVDCADGIDFDAFCVDFWAWGNFEDDWNLSNLTVTIQFS